MVDRFSVLASVPTLDCPYVGPPSRRWPPSDAGDDMREIGTEAKRTIRRWAVHRRSHSVVVNLVQRMFHLIPICVPHQGH